MQTGKLSKEGDRYGCRGWRYGGRQGGAGCEARLSALHTPALSSQQDTVVQAYSPRNSSMYIAHTKDAYWENVSDFRTARIKL